MQKNKFQWFVHILVIEHFYFHFWGLLFLFFDIFFFSKRYSAQCFSFLLPFLNLFKLGSFLFIFFLISNHLRLWSYIGTSHLIKSDWGNVLLSWFTWHNICGSRLSWGLNEAQCLARRRCSIKFSNYCYLYVELCSRNSRQLCNFFFLFFFPLILGA